MSDLPKNSFPDDVDRPSAMDGASPVEDPPLTRRNLPMMLLVARERIVARFRPLLTVHGLTEQQWRVLRVIHGAGVLEQRQIVIACGISAPSLAGVLARMEALGLVARARPAHDQRRVEVTLTPRSREIVAVLAPKIDAVYRKIEEDIDADALADLIESLDKILEVLDAPRDAQD